MIVSDSDFYFFVSTVKKVSHFLFWVIISVTNESFFRWILLITRLWVSLISRTIVFIPELMKHISTTNKTTLFEAIEEKKIFKYITEMYYNLLVEYNFNWVSLSGRPLMIVINCNDCNSLLIFWALVLASSVWSVIALSIHSSNRFYSVLFFRLFSTLSLLFSIDLMIGFFTSSD